MHSKHENMYFHLKLLTAEDQIIKFYVSFQKAKSFFNQAPWFHMKELQILQTFEHLWLVTRYFFTDADLERLIQTITRGSCSFATHLNKILN